MNWISDLDETKFIHGYAFTLGGDTITWRSTKQTIFARSIMELEFKALELVKDVAAWLKDLLANIPLGI